MSDEREAVDRLLLRIEQTADPVMCERITSLRSRMYPTTNDEGKNDGPGREH